MARKLKVFRTATGFSDAYVAAPSRKAALAAWGAENDLFARGMAEEVTDPALTAEPLARPGEVLTVSRGDLGAHLRALQKDRPGKRKPPRTPADSATDSAPEAMKPAARARKARPRPPPRRDRLDKAEAALDEARKRHERTVAGLERERDAAERALEAQRARMDKDVQALARKRDSERRAYEDALQRWSDSTA